MQLLFAYVEGALVREGHSSGYRRLFPVDLLRSHLAGKLGREFRTNA